MANIFASSLSNSKMNGKQRKALASLRWRQVYQHSDSYTYVLEDNQTTLHFKQILNGEMKGLGTGTFVWPAAHVLAKYLEITYPDFGLRGKTICDIGSGTGLTGFVASVLGGDVTLTDQSHILRLLQENLSIVSNDLTVSPHYVSVWTPQQVTIAEYDWDTLQGPSTVFDILLISDCVLPKLYPIASLMHAVHHLMAPHTIALFSYEHRPYPEYDPRMEVQRLCEVYNLVLTVIPASNHHPVYSADDIELWIIQHKSHDHQAHVTIVPLQLLTWGQELESISLLLHGKQVTIKQQPHSSIGCFLWPSSIICSRIVLQQPSWLSAGTDGIVLELGAGCGLTTIALLAAGIAPEQILATDKEEVIQSVLKPNVEQYLMNCDTSSNSSKAQLMALDWEKDTLATSIPSDIKARVKVIVCSDSLYSSHAVSPLLQVLLAIAAEGKSEENERTEDLTVLIVNEQRTALEEFLYLARQENEGKRVKIAEINLTQSDLELIRTSEQVLFAPPLRAIKMSICRREIL